MTRNLGVGLKYRVIYSDGHFCDFLFIGGVKPLVEIIDGNSHDVVPLETVANNYVSINEIK